MQMISWGDFEKVELRVGKIVAAAQFPQARRPAYVLQIDFGEEIGMRKSSAQITALYRPEDLVGRLVVAVVTGFPDANGEVALCVPDRDVPLGTRLL